MLPLGKLPEDLPVPEDDGACEHLLGRSLPSVRLVATSGQAVDPASTEGLLVLYCYPLTGRPDAPLPDNWDQIPGARGCTPQACSFRDRFEELADLDAQLFGLSTQSTNYQREAVRRLRLPFELLSDEELRFTRGLRLPTFTAEGSTLVKRVTLIARDGIIEKYFYPVFPPNENASQVIAWLRGELT